MASGRRVAQGCPGRPTGRLDQLHHHTPPGARMEECHGPLRTAAGGVVDELHPSPLEIGAVHAADGYARASGKVGVVIATSGPGATNLVTGIANAYLDSVPLVAITGNVACSFIGKDSFQEVDITSVTMPP